MSRDGIPEVLNDKNRNKLAGKIMELDDLAYALRFKQADIQRFKADNIENHKGRIRDMLGEWVRANAGEGVLEKFVQALNQARFNNLALELQQQAGIHATGDSSPQEGATAQSSAAGTTPVGVNIIAKDSFIHIGPSNNNKAEFHKDS